MARLYQISLTDRRQGRTVSATGRTRGDAFRKAGRNHAEFVGTHWTDYLNLFYDSVMNSYYKMSRRMSVTSPDGFSIEMVRLDPPAPHKVLPDSDGNWFNPWPRRAS